MEGTTPAQGSASSYSLPPYRLHSEDVIFCIDVDAESLVEMKVLGANGRPITRLDSIKQALLLFVNAKLTMNPDHRFAFAVLGQSVSWVRALFAFSFLDPVYVFHRLFNGLKSSTLPQHQWPVNQKLFTLDVIYLHDKPGPENCPQKVYDMLVDALEHVSEHEGYIFESGQGLSRVLFRQICILLSHPQQRCSQDDLDIPKPLEKKATPSTDPPTTVEESTQHQPARAD
ncbi:hypothetical protein AXF42_Ash005518 [Apostasia shenzhenica]|uniref:BRISC and BRCA1-A complex member 1 n=1 Tax=Apostasia shenzhenica TaxID=1088818 RepID=A0A2I0B747_9ASPA|nr:hypothetical protein AXF42_Ash005518 [Apostasia shenzhenica]